MGKCDCPRGFQGRGSLWKWVFAVATVFSVFAVGAESMAHVYSAWNHSACEKEWRSHAQALGWTLDDILNTDYKKLLAGLDKYAIVVFGTCANFSNPVTPSPEEAARLKDWVSKGGVLIVQDANYDNVLKSWVGAFGNGFACGRGGCSAMFAPTAENQRVDLDADSLLDMPKPLGALLAKRGKQWSHLTGLGPEWKQPVRCADGAALFAYRECGTGLVVLAVSGDYKNDSIAAALLENVAMARRLRLNGIGIVSFERFAQASDRPASGCRLTLKVDPAKAKNLTAKLTAENVAASAKNEVSVSVGVSPEGTATIAPMCEIALKGTVRRTLEVMNGSEKLMSLAWDDARPPALTATLKRRHVFPGDKLQPVYAFNPPAFGRDKIVGIEWGVDVDWKEPQGLTFEAVANNCERALELPPLSVGKHRFSYRLRYEQGFLESLSAKDRALLDWGEKGDADFFVHPDVKCRFRESDRALLVDGKPFFPFGFYDVRGPWGQQEPFRSQMMTNTAAMGYTIVHVGLKDGEQAQGSMSFETFLDNCVSNGVQVLSEFAPHMADSVISRFRNHPAVIGWNPMDEPSSRGITPEQILDFYDHFKTLDRNHICYTVLCIPGQCVKYAPCTDVIAPDLYYNPHGKDVGKVYDVLKDVKPGVDAAGASLWVVLRAFGGQGWESDPVSGREFRAQSYLGVIAGAKGIIYYTYHDLRFDFEKCDEEYKAAVRAFPKEFKPLFPFWLDGKRTVLAEGKNDGIYAATWTLGDKTLYVAVNAWEGTSATAKCPFQGEVLGLDTTASVQKDGDGMTFKLGFLDRVVILK